MNPQLMNTHVQTYSMPQSGVGPQPPQQPPLQAGFDTQQLQPNYGQPMSKAAPYHHPPPQIDPYGGSQNGFVNYASPLQQQQQQQQPQPQPPPHHQQQQQQQHHHQSQPPRSRPANLPQQQQIQHNYGPPPLPPAHGDAPPMHHPQHQHPHHLHQPQQQQQHHQQQQQQQMDPNMMTNRMANMNLGRPVAHSGLGLGLGDGAQFVQSQQAPYYANGGQVPDQYGAPPPPQWTNQAPTINQISSGPRYPAGQNSEFPAPGQQQQQQQQFPYQQSRRLDPDQMPSQIQVIQDDRKNRSGVFSTNAKGQIPPLVTTDFVTEDRGNCNPRFMRATMYSVPTSPDVLKQSAVPFAVVVSPFAKLHPNEFAPPVVELGQMGPVRCVRCKAYMCPFMQFVDGGRRFQCAFCKGTTEVPPEYFAHLDHTGQRLDKFERPELCLGSYEFVATKDYCKNDVFPNSPAIIFVIDVSYSSVKSGMVNLLCSNMKSIVRSLPHESGKTPRVGFVTYSNAIHFYNLKANLAQPQMMVVSDVHDVFMPLLDGFLVDAAEAATLMDGLMEQIQSAFADSRDTETILGPAIQAGLEALKASDCAGKLLVFHSTLPIAEAPGKLRARDDRKLLGTDKEKTILTPQSNYYTQLGQDCVAAACSVDLFTFPTSYVDLATIGQVSRLTGGQIFKYTYFQADVDGERFLEDLKRTIESGTAFDAVMRVRTSTGVRPTEFFGSYYMSNTTDVELASVDCNKAITVEIKHDDKLTEEDAVYVQTAILFTSVAGQRRLRIHNLSLNTCNQMADLYRHCELDTIINYFAKSALRQLVEQAPKTVKEQFVNKCAQILACYRKNCASPSLAGQLILPECMKLLPLYGNCVLKSDPIAGGSEMTTDDRSFVMLSLSSMDVSSTMGLFYPRLLPLHDDIDNVDNVDNVDSLPVALRCSYEKLQDDGAYLLENGIYMFMWVGASVAPEWLQNVFGVQSVAQLDIDRTKLVDLDNPLSQRVRGIVQRVQSERPRYMRLTLVKQRDKLEMVFKHFLVEDKGMSENCPSYVDFLCYLHKEIRSLLS